MAVAVTYIQNDAALDEVVEQNRATTEAIELAQQQTDQIVRQPVAERRQGGLQLRLVDVARVVGVERAEAVLPIGHVLPQGAKVLEADGAAVLLVEHADHQAHRFRIEGGPGAVGEGDLQLVGGDEAAVVLVDAAKRRRHPIWRRISQQHHRKHEIGRRVWCAV